MIAVPLLKNALGYEAKQAHATAIAVIAPVCLISAIVYILGGFADISVVLPAAIGNTLGGLCGARLLGKLPAVFVQSVFIAVMLAAGIRMLFG